jgi:hypothetical protein
MNATAAIYIRDSQEFADLTCNLRVKFQDGSDCPYAMLVGSFAVRPGEKLVDAILRAAKEAEPTTVAVIVDPTFSPATKDALQQLQKDCHQASYDAGWWHHPNSGLPYIPGDDQRTPGGSIIRWDQINLFVRSMIEHYWPFVLATKVSLIHSETSESLEALRKDLFDDKLPHRIGFETETADAMIRQFDIAGAMNRAATLGVVDPTAHTMKLGDAIREKMGFNKTREDHKVATRVAAGGKKF